MLTISDKCLNSFGYRRSDDYPGLKYIWKDLIELKIDEKDFRRHARAFSAWDDGSMSFSEHDFSRLHIAKGEEDAYFQDQLEDPEYYWL